MTTKPSPTWHWTLIGHLLLVHRPDGGRAGFFSTHLGWSRTPGWHGHHDHRRPEHRTRHHRGTWKPTKFAAHLAVSVQTLYDLRSKGRGPRGFRVGRELRFRRSEVDAWLFAARGCRRRPASVGGSPMSRGRRGTAMGTFGQVHVSDLGDRFRALTRFRDTDGRLRKVTATAGSPRAARGAAQGTAALPGRGTAAVGCWSMSSPFGDLVELWLADLRLRDISESTKANYRDDLRLHLQPFFEHFTLGEITTGRVEWFLKGERAVSYSRAKHSRTVLNQVLCVRLAARRDAAQPGRRHLAAGGSRRTRSRRSPWSRFKRSARPPQHGGRDRGSRAPNLMGRSATSSRSCSVPPCARVKPLPCGLAT